jgi:hypothetical protein
MDRVQRMEWALKLMCEPDPLKCETFTSGVGECDRSGRTPDSIYLADRWCHSCLAYFALNGSFPTTIYIKGDE